MRRILLLLALLACPLSADAAITVVQSTTAGANDAVFTFGAGWTSGNVVVIAGVVNLQTTDRVDVTGINATEVDIAQADYGSVYRTYVMCFVVGASDAGDTGFVTTTTGGEAFRGAAWELAGATCTENGTDQGNSDNASPYNLTTPVTTTVNGSFLAGCVGSSTASNFAASGATTAEPSSGADIPGGDDVGVALCGYIITTTAGAYDLPFTSMAAETSAIFAAAIEPSVASLASGPTAGVFGR